MFLFFKKAFSTAETVESTIAIATGKPPLVLSEQELVDCLPNPKQCGGTGGCEGATQWLGFDYVSKNGMASEAGYPYTAADGQCKQFTPVVHPGVIGSFVRIPPNNYSALMNAVVNVGPIAISAAAEPWQTYESGVFSSDCGADVDHAIQLVGFGTDGGSDYWLVRNSWGGSWGEDGYIRIKRFGDKGQEPCQTDSQPGDGTGCKGGPSSVQVCGLCGILSDSSYPIFGAGPGPGPSPGPAPPTPPGPPQCNVDPGTRTDCGFSKTESECEAAGCCYQTSDPSTFKCYNSGAPDVCQQIDPGKRIDCGYTDSKEQCEAAGCCYDGDTPFTFHCFCKNAAPPAPPSPGPAPPSPPPPSPGPPPPPPPSPGPPSGAPYGDPAKGPCLPNEKAVQINGINGKYCAPSCSTSAPCPAVPAPATAAAQCVVSDPNPPPSLCAVICVPGADFLKAGDGGCMTGASCQAIQGTGVCTYPDSNPTTFAFNLSLDLSVDHAEV